MPASIIEYSQHSVFSGLYWTYLYTCSPKSPFDNSRPGQYYSDLIDKLSAYIFMKNHCMSGESSTFCAFYGTCLTDL